jgi:hypothetical protein
LPRVRFTLGTALIGITAAAILFGMVAYHMRPTFHKASIVLIANDHDVDGLAQALFSTEVMESALTTPRPLGPGLIAMPQFRGLDDPVAELRRCLRQERPPDHPDIVVLSTTSTSPTEASEILSAVAASCQRLRGAGHVFVGSPWTRSIRRDDFFEWYLLFMAAQWLALYIKHRVEKRRAKASLAAEASPRPDFGLTENSRMVKC